MIDIGFQHMILLVLLVLVCLLPTDSMPGTSRRRDK
jgi:hypothetical protein